MENKQAPQPVPGADLLNRQAPPQDQIVAATLRLQKEIASINDPPPPTHLPNKGMQRPR
jgi:hypothetical protein